MVSAILLLGLTTLTADAAVEMPQVLDSRLKIELFAAEPDIVTPTGLAVDAQGRVLVVESHTHFRPDDYQGPPADRIRIFQDTDGDGRADRISTFFEGTSWTMNVGVHPDGSVYVATRGDIFRLRDRNGDGRADERTPIAHLETAGNYPHNGLSGFAFDLDGNVYFGLGENKGAEFKLIGSDGSTVSEWEGGQIYRCQADGRRVELVAFGFWNPFHLAFDAFGRLFAVDNDPDSLPPCRLLHIVSGGNYGYRYRNGRKGVHPFTAWNGELPGTLPMVSGTGEAPSGIVAYESDQLPADYIGDLLVTSWGDHRIDRFHLEQRGASFRADGVPIVKGDENFRPVGIAAAPDGSLYVSDWVLKSYNVHGKGRIWHITASQAGDAKRPTNASDAIHSAHRPLREQAAKQLAADAQGRMALEKLAKEDPSSRVRALAASVLAGSGDFGPLERMALEDASVDVRTAAIRELSGRRANEKLWAADQPAEARAELMRGVTDAAMSSRLWNSTSDADAFTAQAARQGLARSHAVTGEIALAKTDPKQRLAGLLVLRETHDSQGRQALPKFLSDPDVSVRFAAIQWVGEERLTEYRQPLCDALSAGPATARLFGGYLAALERLDGVKRDASDEWAGQQYMARALEDAASPPEVRRWALRMLKPDHPALAIDRLREYATSGDPLLELEAVRALRDSRDRERIDLLSQIAKDNSRPLKLRAEAIVGLSGDDPATRSLLLSLALDEDRSLAREALRSLRGAPLDERQRSELVRVARRDGQTVELVERLLHPSAAVSRPAPEDLQAWTKLLGHNGSAADADDAEAGERIFFHAKSVGCSRCHQMRGRGASIGPELTASSGRLSRERLIDSIVRPSKEIAPQFASWLVVTTSGRSLVGMLVKEEATGEQTYADAKGELFELKPDEIETRRPQAVSIMPDELGKQLTVQEFRDLLAFLQSPNAGGN